MIYVEKASIHRCGPIETSNTVGRYDIGHKGQRLVACGEKRLVPSK